MLSGRSTLLTTFAAGLWLCLGPAGFASPAPASAATPVPAHVFSPYFETWTSHSLTTTARHSGARYFTMAFLETLGRDSCVLAWNGESGRRVGSGAYMGDIASLRALGGDVIPSFGGWSADQHGTEIGDSCKDVNMIAAAYEKVITTYDVSRLDMDIEGRSLARTNGIDRRNKAIKLVQDWATANHRPLKISYTLPTTRTGLESDALAVLHNAIANGVRIDIVQPMVFDYYDGEDLDMGKSAITALTGLHNQLKTLLPGKSSAQLWRTEGATLMIGRDDYPTDIETTTVQNAKDVRNFAASKGIAVLSMWAIQRDNGGCPGEAGSDSCSGIAQQTWAFTGALKGF
jgi:hypothetical protein